MKVLPQSKVGLAKGNVLHDWHAEVLAIRAFNRWLVDECADLAKRGSASAGAWVKWRDEGVRTGGQRQPFALQDDVSIHMYCSEAPCGDASMELTMAEQEDATPWETPPPRQNDTQMPGRGHFDQLGIVRRKPARPDAPFTLSKSCSDKLALKQCTSLLSGTTSLLVHPEKAYLSTLVLPQDRCVRPAVERAFGKEGRMKGLRGKTWEGTGYAFRPFEVKTTSREFAFAKRGKTSVPSNLSAVWTPTRQEVLINGVLSGRKQLDPRGASSVSRRTLWQGVVDVALLVGLSGWAAYLQKGTYGELKGSELLEERANVKSDVTKLALTGWKTNRGDEPWSL